MVQTGSAHLIHAHPALVLHMCTLFGSMILHDFVPDDFGCGLMVPLLKDKTGDVSSLNNYRGITLIQTISKVFELIELEICEQYLITDDLQFGFKKGLGCADAIFTLRATIKYFRESGSSVYVATLVISKAFDSSQSSQTLQHSN